MTLSFDTHLKKAQAVKMKWGYFELKSLIDLIKVGHENLVIDWDFPEENWATIKFDDGRQGLICALCPLLVTNDRVIEQIIGSHQDRIETIYIDDFSEELSVSDLSLFSEVFGGFSLDRLSSLKQSTYTIGDIWWSTVN